METGDREVKSWRSERWVCWRKGGVWQEKQDLLIVVALIGQLRELRGVSHTEGGFERESGNALRQIAS
jgi:hypothetical protein